MKKKLGWFSGVSLGVLILYSAVLLFFLVWALTFSFIDYENEIWWGEGNYFILPKTLHWENYENAFKLYNMTVQSGQEMRTVEFGELVYNSVSYAICVALCQVLSPCLMGYITSRFRFKFNAVIDTIVLVAMILPIVGSMPAMMAVVYSLRLDNSLIGMMIMGFVFINMYYFIFKGAFAVLPESYSEAAKMDGASNFRIFITIMLPLVRTTFLSVFVLNFVALWNNYSTALAFAPQRPTVAYAFFVKMSSGSADATRAGNEAVRMAGAMILMVPILLFYAISNRFLMGNLTVGGLKG